jgi:hypothetical protein
MTGDHHGQTAGMATLLVRALDGLLGTHKLGIAGVDVAGDAEVEAGVGEDPERSRQPAVAFLGGRDIHRPAGVAYRIGDAIAAGVR